MNADILKAPNGNMAIAFDDPAYTRSEVISLSRSERTLYAVLHGEAHPIHTLPDELADEFTLVDEISLYAPRAQGGVHHMKATVSVVE